MAKSNDKKTPDKTPRKPSGAFAGGRKGNSGGKPGRSGRKPDWFHEQCRAIIEEHKLLDVVKDIALDKDATKRDKISAVRFLASYAHGKPPETIRVEGEVTHTHSPAEQLLNQLESMGKRSDGKRVH